MLRASGLLLLAVLVAACAESIRPLSPAEAAAHLPDLVDGRTTQEQVLLTLGIPSAEFQAGSILAYQLRQAPDGRLHVVSREVSDRDPRLREWPPGTYSLILVFGTDHVLSRHALLLIE